jgi:hypothetical protein
MVYFGSGFMGGIWVGEGGGLGEIGIINIKLINIIDHR